MSFFLSWVLYSHHYLTVWNVALDITSCKDQETKKKKPKDQFLIIIKF